MKFILGTKEYMTQMFDEKGNVHPVTVVAVAANVVTQVKKAEGADKYDAVQVAYGERREKRVTKSLKGHVAKAGEKLGKKILPKKSKEFRCAAADVAKFNVGDEIKVDTFAAGDVVQVSGLNKAKGFQGVVKRHGFHGGPRSHGQKHSERAPGSLGAGGVQRVFKGMRMAGRMGAERVTTKNIRVLRVDADKNELYLRGAVPGRRGTLIEIRNTKS
jgi:large subunit ribosomal protein L3